MLTNPEIVKMVRAQLGDDLIIEVIERNTPDFDLSPDALVALKKEGVSQKVLNAMLRAQRPRGVSSNQDEAIEESGTGLSEKSDADLPQGFGGFVKISDEFVHLQKESISGTRREKGIVGRFVDGVKDAKTINLYRGESSGVLISDSKPNIYLAGAESSSTNLFLLKLRQSQGKREVVYARTNVLGKGSEGFSNKDLRPVSTKRINDNLFS